MRQVWNTIAQFHMLDSGDRVLIGVSGGPDSVALLHLLNSKAEQYGIALYVVHVNHMLRPEADAEAEYVKTLAERYDIPFRLYTVDVSDYAKANDMSLEQAGHTVRFQCFQDAKEYWQINKLALGHHRDDRAESALLHIVQGCGLDGLTAMPPMDIWDTKSQSYLIRPLAQISKKDVLQYCKEQDLHYFIDATNLEPEYLRNQIRLEVLPLMRQYNPQIADALVRLQDSAGADLAYLEEQVHMLWIQYGSASAEVVQFPADVFQAQHIAIQRRLLRHMYRLWKGSTVNLSFAQVEQMCRIALQSDGTQQVSLSEDVVFLRQYQLLKITAKPQCTVFNEYVWQTDIQPVLQTWNGVFSVQMDVQMNEAVCEDGVCAVFVDADSLTIPLTVRGRQSGDVITFSNMQKHKTIKKYFIDKKIPKEERDTIPLVLSGENIIWIPGYYLADHVRITGDTKRICKLCFSLT